MKKETSFYGESQSLFFSNGKFSTDSCDCRRQTVCLHAAFASE